MAILLVVLYHAQVPGFSGGFVGVDVFFVVSGYLITSRLMAETDSTGRVRLGHFWARRVRRLVPALALMVAVTLLACVFVLARIDLTEVARQGGAAALYVSNLTFGRQAQDYFATPVTASPFLHTWSLGVEEQFYLVWPVVLALVAAAVGRRRRAVDNPAGRRQELVVVLLVMAAASFGLNLLWSSQGSVWAFYSLPTRVWEFAVAGLLAAVASPRLLLRRGIATAAGVVGLVLLAWATLAFSDRTVYPGLAAVVPVAGTLLLIAGGRPRAGAGSSVARVLSTGPLQWLGRVSYSWYLWHWPFIVLAVAALDHDSVALRLAASGVALGVAAAAFHFYENPIRFSPRLVPSTGRTFAAGAMLTAAVLAIVATTAAVGNTHPSGFDTKIAAAQISFVADSLAGCGLKTSLVDDLTYCVNGPPSAAHTVLLVGDSHAVHWMDAMAQVAHADGARLVTYYQAGCPAIPVNVRQVSALGASVRTCADAHAQLATLIQRVRPQVLIISQTESYVPNILDAHGNVPDRATQLDLWRRGYESLLAMAQRDGMRVGVILDSPFLAANPNECLSKTHSVTRCEPGRTAALSSDAALRTVDEHLLAEHPRIGVFSPDSVLCNKRVCHVWVDDQPVYIDSNHLTSLFTLSEQGRLQHLVKPLLSSP